MCPRIKGHYYKGKGGLLKEWTLWRPGEEARFYDGHMAHTGTVWRYYVKQYVNMGVWMDNKKEST